MAFNKEKVQDENVAGKKAESDNIKEIKAKIATYEKQGGQEGEVAGLKALLGE